MLKRIQYKWLYNKLKIIKIIICILFIKSSKNFSLNFRTKKEQVMQPILHSVACQALLTESGTATD